MTTSPWEAEIIRRISSGGKLSIRPILGLNPIPLLQGEGFQGPKLSSKWRPPQSALTKAREDEHEEPGPKDSDVRRERRAHLEPGSNAKMRLVRGGKQIHSSRCAQPQSEGCPLEPLSVHNLGLHRDAEIAFAIALQRISQLLEQAPQMQNCHTFLLTGIPNG